MLRYVVITYRFHIHDLFDEIPVMSSRGTIKCLFKYLHLYQCLNVFFHSRRFHGVLGSGPSPILEKEP